MYVSVCVCIFRACFCDYFSKHGVITCVAMCSYCMNAHTVRWTQDCTCISESLHNVRAFVHWPIWLVKSHQFDYISKPSWICWRTPSYFSKPLIHTYSWFSEAQAHEYAEFGAGKTENVWSLSVKWDCRRECCGGQMARSEGNRRRL